MATATQAPPVEKLDQESDRDRAIRLEMEGTAIADETGFGD